MKHSFSVIYLHALVLFERISLQYHLNLTLLVLTLSINTLSVQIIISGQAQILRPCPLATVALIHPYIGWGVPDREGTYPKPSA